VLYVNLGAAKAQPKVGRVAPVRLSFTTKVTKQKENPGFQVLSCKKDGEGTNTIDIFGAW